MRVFINYRTGDGEVAASMVSHFLTGRLGEANVFLDGRSIEPGTRYDDELLRRVWRSDVLIAIMGPAWVTAKTKAGLDITDERDWVRKELVEAFSHQVKVVPVLVGDAPWPRVEELPDVLAELNHCQFIRLDLMRPAVSLERVAAAVGASEAPAAVAAKDAGVSVSGTATVSGDGNTTITGVHLGDGNRWR